MRRREKNTSNRGYVEKTLRIQPKAVDRDEALRRIHFIDRLRDIDDVRTDLVVRGCRLVEDPDYPDRATLRSVAEILATHM